MPKIIVNRSIAFKAILYKKYLFISIQNNLISCNNLETLHDLEILFLLRTGLTIHIEALEIILSHGSSSLPVSYSYWIVHAPSYFGMHASLASNS